MVKFKTVHSKTYSNSENVQNKLQNKAPQKTVETRETQKCPSIKTKNLNRLNLKTPVERFKNIPKPRIN
jgi:hypothetical protein